MTTGAPCAMGPHSRGRRCQPAGRRPSGPASSSGDKAARLACRPTLPASAPCTLLSTAEWIFSWAASKAGSVQAQRNEQVVDGVFREDGGPLGRSQSFRARAADQPDLGQYYRPAQPISKSSELTSEAKSPPLDST
jgi:hypothetical protein